MKGHRIVKGGAWEPVGPQGLLVKATYTSDLTVSSPGTSLLFGDLDAYIPEGGWGTVRMSFSFNQYTGAILSRLNFWVDGAIAGYRTNIGNPTTGGASGNTFTYIVEGLLGGGHFGELDHSAGEHNFGLELQTFTAGTVTYECSSDAPAFFTVEGI